MRSHPLWRHASQRVTGTQCRRRLDRACRRDARRLGHAITAESLREALARSDVIISSTSAPGPVLHRSDLESALALRSAGRPRRLLLINLAVPRDVDPAVSALADVELYTIEDLHQVMQCAIAGRRAELPAAYSILCGEVARFARSLGAREAMTQSGLLGHPSGAFSEGS
jgi:glutamyl-tRNA reductase